MTLGHLAVEQQSEPLGMAELGGSRVGLQIGKGPRHAGKAKLVKLIKGGMGKQGVPRQW